MSLSRVLSSKRLVQDGSMGTALEELVPLDHPLSVKGLPLWSTKILLQEPLWVTNVHKSYVDVGAQMLITATYQASSQTLLKFADLDLEGAKQTWQTSIDCALDAIKLSAKSEKIYVAGSIGPYGAYLANGAEYSGDYDGLKRDALANYHQEHLKFFVENEGVDVIAFETIPNFDEVKGIFDLIHLVYTSDYHKDFYLTLSCKTPETLVDGTPLTDVIEYIYSQLNGPVAQNFIGSGSNCISYELVSGIISTFNETAKKLTKEPLPLVIYPNLGFENDMSNVSEYQFRSDTNGWTAGVRDWLKIPNVRIIGGCCSTGPAEVEIIAKELKRLDN